MTQVVSQQLSESCLCLVSRVSKVFVPESISGSISAYVAAWLCCVLGTDGSCCTCSVAAASLFAELCVFDVFNVQGLCATMCVTMCVTKDQTNHVTHMSQWLYKLYPTKAMNPLESQHIDANRCRLFFPLLSEVLCVI